MLPNKILTPFLLLTFLMLLGCGPDGPILKPVEGTITYNGKKITNGSIVFVPIGNLPSSVGIIDTNGSYKMKTQINGVQREGTALGDHKVMIVSIQDTSNKLPEDRIPLPPPNIPSHFGDSNQSGLTAKVEDKINIINFDLK